MVIIGVNIFYCVDDMFLWIKGADNKKRMYANLSDI